MYLKNIIIKNIGPIDGIDIGADWDCNCHLEQCNVFGNFLLCARGLCPGSNYCCTIGE